MKGIVKKQSMVVTLSIMALMFSCSKDEVDLGNVNPQAEDINNYIRLLPDWNNGSIEQNDSVFIEDVLIPEAGIPYQCDIYEKKLVRSLENIVSVETNFGTVWPGSIIQGNTLEGGELQPLNLARAPITIQTDMPVNETFKEINDPNSVTVQQAIADFQVAAGQMPEGSEAGAGLMNFTIEEVASFEQAMLAMGISGGFTDPESQVGLEASANVSVERAFSEHTVIVKFVQEMFNVRLADDLLPDPADFFGPQVNMDDIQGLEAKSELGEDNIPLYVESVTYGRIMLFTMKSTSVSSASQLSAAVEASMDDYLKGGGSLTDEQKKILDNSTTTIFSAGGTKEAANAAIATLNWSEFFKAAPATTAVPISFVARTLNGKKIVKIVDNAVYKQRSHCDEPSSYNITVEWTDTETTGACIGACPRQSWVKPQDATFGTQLTALNSYTYEMIFTKDDVKTQSAGSFNIKSVAELILPPGALATKIEDEPVFVLDLNNGNNTVTHILQNWAGSVTMTYNVRKVSNYDN